jgi:serine/threonine protein kinase
VFKAIRQPTPFSSGPVTPPTSPVAPSISLLAIKVPMQKNAETILEHEGEILTYVSKLTGAENFVPPFFGLIPKFTALVLGAVPLSLEEHILTCAMDSKQKLSTRNMNDPVVGSSRVWLDLAHKVITALHWLHDEASVVHGDIKPGNILLRPNSHGPEISQFPFRPVLIDFSSSHLMHNGNTNPHSLSAVTREYTAPELLSSAVLRDPKSTATRPSDVFSTAVTLLVAATGDTKVYSGSVFQRQAMATQGWQVLQLVRNGDHGSRVPPFGAVERTLERAVLKAGMGRLTAGQWVEVVEEMMVEEPAKVF